MGMNFYLLRKINFINNEQTPASLGCGYEENQVQELANGFVWQNTYYPTIDELNKVFYQLSMPSNTTIYPSSVECGDKKGE